MMTDQTEYFIVANSFAAPFCSDQSTGFQAGRTPVGALEAFAVRYKHPAGLYAAAAYASAEAYHKGEKAVAQWLSNHARTIQEKKPTSILSHGPGSVELDGKAVKIDSPKAGRAVLLALALMFLPSFAQAQTPVIAATVKAVFTASPDHNATFEGNPAVLNYILDTITMTRPVPTGPLVGGALALSIPLGKPTPDASNTITVAVPTLFSGLTNGVYTSTVTAVGPGGATAVSPVSDPFVRLGPPRPAGKPSVGQ